MAEPRTTGRWLHTWIAAVQPADPVEASAFGGDRVFGDTTLRQTVRASLGGVRVRLRISNVYGREPVNLSGVTVATPAQGRSGVSAVAAGTLRRLTFHGRPSVAIPAGAQIVSDAVDFPVSAGAGVAVTLHVADGIPADAVTSHPGSRTTSYVLTGNQVAEPDLPGATPVEHWYLLGGLEVWAPPEAVALAVLGDSLTDGRGTTTDQDERWPDRLFGRLQLDPSTRGVAVLNQGIGGNRILDDGLGPHVLRRLDRDVLAVAGVAWLVVFAGINDIGTAAATPAAQKEVADRLIGAYDQIVTQAHAHDIRVYGATLLPFGGNDMYDDPDGHRESARRTVNTWIRTGGRFDAVLDFERAVQSPDNPLRLAAGYDVGDHLHLNPAGYQALADAVPAHLFTQSGSSAG